MIERKTRLVEKLQFKDNKDESELFVHFIVFDATLFQGFALTSYRKTMLAAETRAFKLQGTHFDSVYTSTLVLKWP